IVFHRPAPRLGEHNEELGVGGWGFGVRSGPTANPEPPSPNPQLPFAGLRVLDFSWAVAGPAVTQCLATYGATVLRIESPRRPDPIRTMAPFAGRRPGLNRAGHWARVNTGKRSVSLNLDHPGGLALARRLVGWAEVVVESYRSGIMQR